MKKKHWLYALLIALLVGLIVAAVMTLLDWRLNPGGIFRDDNGTDWRVVTETAVSWFLPVAVAAGIVVVLLVSLLAWIAHRRDASR